MSEVLTLKNKGLFTNSNQLSGVPEGALSVAKNVVIDKDDVIEPCRGFGRIADPPVSADVRHDRITSFQDKIIVRRSNDNKMAYYVSGAGYTDFSGTYAHPDSDYARMQFSQENGNLYFTTSEGVKVLDAYTGPVYATGMPRGLDGSGATTGASGFMTNNTQVAYRIVWGSRDANNNLYLGTPSQRITVANSSGGTRDVSLTFTIPEGISTADFYQVYRSKESATAADEANDELQLVYEKNPTSGEITAKSITFTDAVPVSLMGASLYTNASQEGIAESNDEPPLAKDITTFKNYTFFGNVKTKHKLSIKMLAVGGSGLALNDTITIDGDVYTAKGAESIPSAEFLLTTGGSPAQNIADTARSLIKVINQYTGNTGVYAYYLSGYQDLPGQILIMKRTLADVSFTVTTSKAAAFDLDTGTSSNDSYAHGLMYSKNQQPEHVPTAHILYVGSKNYPIRRILGLRDSLFILKDDGVFRLTGSGGQWNVSPLDVSTRIIAPDSAVVLNNSIFSLTDQGIVTISDVGVQVISRPIEDQILALISADYTKLKTLSFGVSYETDRKYYLWTIQSGSDSYPTHAFVYNTFTQAWTTRVKDVKHAFVNRADDKMYLCNPSDKHVLQERKALNFTDYIDEEMDGFSVSSYSSTDVVMNTVSGVTVGDLLYESSTKYALITAIDNATNTLTINTERAWSGGAVSIFKGIECQAEYAIQDCDNPSVMKHFQEVQLLFRDIGILTGYLAFFTDLSGGYQSTLVEGSYTGSAWGLFVWGTPAWGGVSRPKPSRVLVPREKSRGTVISLRFTVRNAYARWSMNGISLFYEWVSERNSRA